LIALRERAAAEAEERAKLAQAEAEAHAAAMVAEKEKEIEAKLKEFVRLHLSLNRMPLLLGTDSINHRKHLRIIWPSTDGWCHR
jgi:hypothetical protein